ncbi:MAG: hypothetical protein PVI23_13455 [Maricaulaceae bacterium]|jgi:hypothetical protein
MHKSFIWMGLSAYAVFALASAMVGGLEKAIDLGTLADLFREPLAAVVQAIGAVAALFFDVDFAPVAIASYAALYVISLFAITMMNLKPGVGGRAIAYGLLHTFIGLIFFPLLFLVAAFKPRRSDFQVPRNWFWRMISGAACAVIIIVVITGYAMIGALELTDRISAFDECFEQMFATAGSTECVSGPASGVARWIADAFNGFANADLSGQPSDPGAEATTPLVALVVFYYVVMIGAFMLPAGLAVGHKIRIKRMLGRVFFAGLIAVGVAVASLALETVWP